MDDQIDTVFFHCFDILERSNILFTVLCTIVMITVHEHFNCTVTFLYIKHVIIITERS